MIHVKNYKFSFTLSSRERGLRRAGLCSHFLTYSVDQVYLSVHGSKDMPCGSIVYTCDTSSLEASSFVLVVTTYCQPRSQRLLVECNQTRERLGRCGSKMVQRPMVGFLQLGANSKLQPRIYPGISPGDLSAPRFGT